MTVDSLDPLPAAGVAPQSAIRLETGIIAVVLMFFGQLIGAFLAHGLVGSLAEAPGGRAWIILGGDIVALAFLYYFVRHNLAGYGAGHAAAIGWRRRHFSGGKTGALIAVTYLATAVCSLVYGSLFLGERGTSDGAAEQTLASVLEAGEFVSALVLGIIYVLIAPVLEELVFRGYLQSAFRHRMSSWAAISAAAAIFAAYHLSLALWPIYFIIGLGIGFVFECTGSIKAAVALHAINNLVAVLLKS